MADTHFTVRDICENVAEVFRIETLIGLFYHQRCITHTALNDEVSYLSTVTIP